METAARLGARVLTLKPYTPPAEIAALAAAERADAIIVRAAHVTDEVIGATPTLKVIVKHGIGVDTIDLASATRRRIPVLITHGANAQSVAEHAFGLMFAVMRRTAWLDSRMRAGHWDKATSFGHELFGRSLGIVGLGSIGSALVELVRPLRMHIRGYDPFFRGDIAGVEIVGDIDDLLRQSDIVSLHAPLTADNRNLIDARRLSLMKPGAVLINTARGGLVDHEALAAALSGGALSGAGIDCFPSEPPADNPLANLPNVVMTPHVGANTREAAERVGIRAIEQALDVIAGRRFDPRANVNPGYADTAA
ncbi:NAD(P)-dependent oxidoreductase [Allostella humosa]|nr:NAD(P)-dependent oxidoreductase [Stella humosa]